jgi:putative NADH-flavin reductase
MLGKLNKTAFPDTNYKRKRQLMEVNMKLAIFGGTGRTGQYLVTHALEADHHVVVLARTPSKLVIDDDRLTIVHGDVTDRQKVEETIAGTDAVISVLGPTSNSPDYLVSQGMQHIVAAMKNHSIKRLVISAGAGVADPNDKPKLINKLLGFLVRMFSRYVYEDMVRTVETVRQSDLDWTIVRVPMLTDDPATGDVKVAYVGKGMGSRLSRSDLATFMLEQVKDQTYFHQAPAISN